MEICLRPNNSNTDTNRRKPCHHQSLGFEKPICVYCLLTSYGDDAAAIVESMRSNKEHLKLLVVQMCSLDRLTMKRHMPAFTTLTELLGCESSVCRNADGWIALYICVEDEKLDAIKVLLKNGAEVQGRYEDTIYRASRKEPFEYSSCISRAVDILNFPLVTILLNHGASPNVPSGIGLIAVDSSLQKYLPCFEILQLLLKHGLNLLQIESIYYFERWTKGLTNLGDNIDLEDHATMVGLVLLGLAREEHGVLTYMFFHPHTPYDFYPHTVHVDGHPDNQLDLIWPVWASLDVIKLLFEQGALGYLDSSNTWTF